MPYHYLLLFFAIVTEVLATLSLKASNGWEQRWWGVVAVILYGLSLFLLGIVQKSISVGITYSIWAGTGIALVCLASAVLWQQRFDGYALLGIAFIIVGTLLITLKSGVVFQ